jgi:hypothetical protein
LQHNPATGFFGGGAMIQRVCRKLNILNGRERMREREDERKGVKKR